MTANPFEGPGATPYQGYDTDDEPEETTGPGGFVAPYERIPYEDPQEPQSPWPGFIPLPGFIPPAEPVEYVDIYFGGEIKGPSIPSTQLETFFDEVNAIIKAQEAAMIEYERTFLESEAVIAGRDVTIAELDPDTQTDFYVGRRKYLESLGLDKLPYGIRPEDWMRGPGTIDPAYADVLERGETYQQGLRDDFGPPQFNWQQMVYDRVYKDFHTAAGELGYDRAVVEAWLANETINALNYVSMRMQQMGLTETGQGQPQDPISVGLSEQLLRTPQGSQVLYEWARTFLLTKWPELAVAMPEGSLRSSGRGRRGGGGGGGGRGRGGLTVDDFDLVQLSEAIKAIWNGLLMADPPNARAIAQEYVNLILANPTVKVDFETWVRQRARQTARYKALYQHKPEGISEEQFLQPYLQAALQLLGPGAAALQAAAGAVQFNAGVGAFRQRLQRQQNLRGEAPFMSSLSGRLSRLRGILRG